MSQREYAEDTIWWSIKDATTHAPHRRTVVLFHTNTSALRGRPNPLTWVDNTGQVWPELRAVLRDFDPRRIALNTDRNIAFGGGLHVGELEVLKEELGEEWMAKTVNEPMLGIEFVAKRTPGQITYYKLIMETIWAMLEEGFSERTIVVNVTTTVVGSHCLLDANNRSLIGLAIQDLEWWFLEKMQAQNVSYWAHPRVSVLTPESFPGWEGTDDVIQEGDLLHIDFGMTAMGMNTDTQHMAYVLRSSAGETEPPPGLKAGLQKSNRMMDIVLQTMRSGLTGNEVLSICLAQMKKEGIEGQIYSHPIGDWGHAPGAVMGA